MFINDVIKKINNLNDSDNKLFEIYAYQYQKDYLKKEKLRRADFKVQLDNFISKQTVKIAFDNLDSYIYALNRIEFRDKKEQVSQSSVMWKTESWKDLLSRIEFPIEINFTHMDKNNIRIIQNIVINLLLACEGDEIEETSRKLKLLNDFITEFIENSGKNNRY